MALVARYKMEPGENRKHTVDMTDALDDTETITAIPTPTVSPITSPPLVVTRSIDLSRKLFSFFAGGGVDQTEYTVTFIVTTSIGQVIELDVKIDVENST